MTGNLYNKLQQMTQHKRIIVLTRKYKWALVLRPFWFCGSNAFVEILKIDTRTPVEKTEFYRMQVAEKILAVHEFEVVVHVFVLPARFFQV